MELHPTLQISSETVSGRKTISTELHPAIWRQSYKQLEVDRLQKTPSKHKITLKYTMKSTNILKIIARGICDFIF